MRIRSIKPEFWRSDDIATLPISTRLTFIGLWSYVDDNGVGADKLVSIVADLYADDFSNDPQETVMRVSEDLGRLTSGGQVTRYRADHNGSPKDLLYITQWKAHQKIQHPSLGHKYPLPPAELIKSQETLTTVSVDPHEGLTHEQGNRGTRNSGTGEGDPDAEASEPPPRCIAHMNDENPPNCHGCRRAREANDAWRAGELERRRKAREAAKARTDACTICNGTGQVDVAENAVRPCECREAAHA